MSGFVFYNEIILKDLALYGSGRIGLVQVNASQTNYVYELADHLDNVRATVQKASNGSLKLVSAADYYPFGMIMPDRGSLYLILIKKEAISNE